LIILCVYDGITSGKGVIILNTKTLVGWVLAFAAVNWGLVGLLQMNLVETLLGAGSTLTTVAYVVVGLVGVYKVYLLTLGGGKKK
jgi:uncharacterized membrane protein YuzA (DUF378 family)